MANTPLPPATKVSELLADALIDAGVVGIDEQIEQPILTRAFKQANFLLRQWQRKRFLVYHLVDYPVVSTGAQSYTVGAGGSFNINPRPDRIESAFLRQLQPASGAGSQVDFPMEIIPAREDYNRIVLKTLGTFSNSIFYDSGWPVATLYPWPVPQASIYEMHVTFKETLNQFQNLQQEINLPPEYEPALEFCLARRLRATYQMPMDPEINRLAREALNVIRLANVQIPLLTMPRPLRAQGGSNYNYKSDTP